MHREPKPRSAWPLTAIGRRFAGLVDEHHAAMVRVAYVVAGDAELAVDAVPSAWEVAWRRLRTLRQPDRLRAWLVAIAANESRQSLRRQRRVTFAGLNHFAWGVTPPRG